jgi:hypothetical protein
VKKGIFAIALSLTALFGCATSTFSVGTDFPIEKTVVIEKGKTTASELSQIFGEPYSKSVISENEEKWIYFYSASTAKAQSYIVTMDVKTTGIQKTLDVLLKNDVVVNYTITQNNNPSSMQIN